MASFERSLGFNPLYSSSSANRKSSWAGPVDRVCFWVWIRICIYTGIANLRTYFFSSTAKQSKFFFQVYSFPFWKKVSPWFRIIPIIIYFAVVSALCATVVKGREPGQSGFTRMYEMFFIPAQEYLTFFLNWLFLYLFIVIEGIIKDKKRDENPEVSAGKQAAYLCGVVIIYAVFILISYLARHLTGNFTLYMIMFVFIFTIGVCISIMFFKQLMGPFKKLSGKTKVCQANIEITDRSNFQNQKHKNENQSTEQI